MAEEFSELIEAAQGLIQTDRMLGGDFMPRQRNPLPPLQPLSAQPQAAASSAQSRAAHPQTASPSAPIFQPAATGSLEEKAQSLKELDEQMVRPCGACILARTRTQTVFGEGSPGAQLVFVGEGPGEEEDRTGRPFVGRAGELLTKMIAAMGLTRGDVYICNVVKCRPPANRTPAPDEVQACNAYLIRQLQIIAPRVIVTLGNPATQHLLNTKVGITRLRGQWQKLPNIAPGLEGTPVMPTFHPAYVLRNYSLETRGQVWDDLKKVMDLLGIKKPG